MGGSQRRTPPTEKELSIINAFGRQVAPARIAETQGVELALVERTIDRFVPTWTAADAKTTATYWRGRRPPPPAENEDAEAALLEPWWRRHGVSARDEGPDDVFEVLLDGLSSNDAETRRHAVEVGRLLFALSDKLHADKMSAQIAETVADRQARLAHTVNRLTGRLTQMQDQMDELTDRDRMLKAAHAWATARAKDNILATHTLPDDPASLPAELVLEYLREGLADLDQPMPESPQ